MVEIFRIVNPHILSRNENYRPHTKKRNLSNHHIIFLKQSDKA